MAPAADSPATVDNLSPHVIASPRRRRPRFLALIAALVVIAVVALFAILGGDGDGGASLGSIETPDGSITIDEVEVGERLPPGCGSSEFGCLVAGSGRMLVKVSFSGDAVPEVSVEDPDVYLESADGDRSDVDAVGRSIHGDGGDRLDYLVFATEVSDCGFTLHWGDESIELGNCA